MKQQNKMATRVDENTQLTLDLKTIGMIVGFVISLATIFFSLKSDIALALPQPEVSSIEFQYKDELVRSTIEKVETDVNLLRS